MSILTDSLLGRYLLWRAPSPLDLHRFPSAAVDGGGSLPRPDDAAAPPALAALKLPATGRWPGGRLQALLEGSSSSAFLVLRGGEVAFEWYAPGWTGWTVGRTMSVTKSVTSLMVGQAIGDGRLPGIDAPVGDLVPGIVDAGVARLTLAQLLRMDSGIRFRESLLPWQDSAGVYHGSRLRQRTLRVPLSDPVGRYFHYNDWHPLLVALAIERASRSPVADVLSRGLWAPLGGGEASLSLDHAGTAALAHLDSGFNASAYGLARLGQLVLQRGRWAGEPLVPGGWMARLDDLSDAWHRPEHFAYYVDRRLPWGRPLSSGHYAYKDFWWHHCPAAGVHDLFAMGALGAHVYVSRDTDCVIVRLADSFPPGLWWASLLRRVAEAAAA